MSLKPFCFLDLPITKVELVHPKSGRSHLYELPQRTILGIKILA
jgi:hypothetical protein